MSQWDRLTCYVAELFSFWRCGNMEATRTSDLEAFQVFESRYSGDIRAELRLTLELIQQLATFIHRRPWVYELTAFKDVPQGTLCGHMCELYEHRNWSLGVLANFQAASPGSLRKCNLKWIGRMVMSKEGGGKVRLRPGTERTKILVRELWCFGVRSHCPDVASTWRDRWRVEEGFGIRVTFALLVNRPHCLTPKRMRNRKADKSQSESKEGNNKSQSGNKWESIKNTKGQWNQELVIWKDKQN